MILKHRNLVVERIVSSAAMVPCEYVQPQDEWVVLVQGDATLQVAGETMALKAGDYLFLPAGVPHTVQRISEGRSGWRSIFIQRRRAMCLDFP